jgi:hypothetical protein
MALMRGTLTKLLGDGASELLKSKPAPQIATTEDPYTARSYFFASGVQFISSVIGLAEPDAGCGIGQLEALPPTSPHLPRGPASALRAS